MLAFNVRPELRRRLGGGGALLGEVAEARVKVGAEGFERVLELEGGVDVGGAGVHAGELRRGEKKRTCCCEGRAALV